MATIYFSNTADSGDGSFRKALEQATASDVVAPDPTVFRQGELITITLSSYAPVVKSTTLVAGTARPRLVSASGITLYARTGGEFLRVEGYEFVGRVLAYFPESSFSRCLFAGNAETAHLVQGTAGSGITLTDCLVVGAKRSGVYQSGARSSLTLTRTTVAGCVRPISVGSTTTFASVDSIVDPVCSEAGFIAPPPDELSSEVAGALPWEEWNLGLRADSLYATGATSAAGTRDLFGFARGRVVNGATVYAVGAFEVVTADYYYVGSGDSFNAASNWRTAQGGQPASIVAGVFFLSESVTWRDAPPEGSTIIVAGRRTETFCANAKLARLEAGEGAALVFSGTDRVVSAQSARLAPGVAFLSSPERGGYFAVPGGVDVSDATFVGATACEFGAGLTAFRAVSDRPGRASLTWRASDESATILIERRESSGSWRVVAESVAASSGALEVVLGTGRASFRAFDGETFLLDDAWSFSGIQYRVVASAVAGERAARGWEALAVVSGTSETVMVGQGITILARIFDAFDTDAPLLSDGANVASVAYTCYYVSKGLFEETLTPVPGHEEVDAGADCVLESLQTSDAWTVDDVGYSFVLTPDVRDALLFEKAGEYRIKIVVRLTSGNPVTFYAPVTVVER